MKTRRALITGISGQDGAYLAQYLLTRDYTVIGAINPKRKSELTGLKTLGIFSKIEQAKIDVTNADEVHRFFRDNKVDEVYHLAAQSSVAASFYNPAKTLQYNIISVINLLESIRTLSQSVHFYNASSSEMYGNVSSLPITLSTPFNPLSSYAVSKVAAHQIVKSYRESYGLFAVSGVLFNHESPLRKHGFFTKKLIQAALDLKAKKIESVSFGNLNVKRDFGYAPEYVRAMWLMLQQELPEDFIICTGVSVSLRDLVEHVFKQVGVSPDAIKDEPSLHRKNDIIENYGDPRDAFEKLGWKSSLDAFSIMNEMLDGPLERTTFTETDRD